MRHGFYWLTAHTDTVDIFQRCAGCQKYANQTHVPSSALKTIPITWSFAVWGMDMVGPFKKAPSGFTHLLVAVEKFTKWVEAKPVQKCDGKTATKFLRELIYRYGFPNSIITDNGTNFAKGAMAEFCEEHHIRLDLASVAHPESNGQAERANQSILHGLKPRLQVPLERTAGCWVEELPSVIWGIRTSVNRSTGFTPFFMVYGAEAVMPTDLEHESPRIVHYTEATNELARQDGLDQLDEARDLARSRTAIYQQGLRRYYSRRVKTRTFQEGDLVLRLIQDKKGMHKLSPPWEGPFAIGRVLGNDAYYITDVQGHGKLDVKRPWNVNLLRKFYSQNSIHVLSTCYEIKQIGYRKLRLLSVSCVTRTRNNSVKLTACGQPLVHRPERPSSAFRGHWVTPGLVTSMKNANPEPHWSRLARLA